MTKNVKPDLAEFCQMLKGLREQAQMTREQLAELARVSPNSISFYEKNRDCSIDVLAVYAHISGLSLYELIRRRLQFTTLTGDLKSEVNERVGEESTLINKSGSEAAQPLWEDGKMVSVGTAAMEIRRRWGSDPDIRVVRHLGKRFAPQFKPDDLLFLDTSDNEVIDHGYYAGVFSGHQQLCYIQILDSGSWQVTKGELPGAPHNGWIQEEISTTRQKEIVIWGKVVACVNQFQMAL